MPVQLAILAAGAGAIAWLWWFFFAPRESERAAPVPNLSRAHTPTLPHTHTDLAITGMTCAACVGRVERALKRAPGVHDATVNLLANRGSVEYDPGVTTPEQLAQAVEETGYGASLVSDLSDSSDRSQPSDSPELAQLRIRFIVAAVLTAPVLIGSMGMDLHLPGIGWLANPWLQLALTTPVLFWAGARFYRGAWAALRHRAADMNTLIAIGTGSAYLYSVAATVAPGLFHRAGLTYVSPSTFRVPSARLAAAHAALADAGQKDR